MKKIIVMFGLTIFLVMLPIIAVSAIVETIEGWFDFVVSDGSFVQFHLPHEIRNYVQENHETLDDSLLTVCVFQADSYYEKMMSCLNREYLESKRDELMEDSLYVELVDIITDQGYDIFHGVMPDFDYLTTFTYPVNGAVTSPYGFRISPITSDIEFHNALDIAAATGTPVHSFTSGRVVKVASDSTRGNYMIVESDNVLEYPPPDCKPDEKGGMICTYEVDPEDQNVIILRTWYLHLNAFKATPGSISNGSIIAEVGATGAVTGFHVHFAIEVSINGSQFQFVNPYLFV